MPAPMTALAGAGRVLGTTRSMARSTAVVAKAVRPSAETSSNEPLIQRPR